MPGYEQAPTETKIEHERRLIVLAQQGDRRALDWLFSRQGPIAWLRRAAAKRLWDFPDRIDDVVAETELRILEKLDQAPEEGFMLSIWARKILNFVVREFWNEIRNDRKRRADIAVKDVKDDDDGDEPLDALEGIADPSSVGSDGLTSDEASWSFAQLTAAIDSIVQTHFDPQKREYLRLYLRNKITEEFDTLGEIAERVGLSAGSADRARKQLAKLAIAKGLASRAR